jgi:hypothetical protein
VPRSFQDSQLITSNGREPDESAPERPSALEMIREAIMHGEFVPDRCLVEADLSASRPAAARCVSHCCS